MKAMRNFEILLFATLTLSSGNTLAQLTSTGDQFWNQNSTGILESSQGYDEFGYEVATGDFNGDGFDDLAIGVPWEDPDAGPLGGAVNVIYGSGNGVGLTSSGNQLWSQNSPGILGETEDYDAFGLALAAGDFDGDGYDDLAIGAPDEAIGDSSEAGAVNVLYGSRDGLTSSGNQIWHQDSPGILGGSESGDTFGSSVATGDFDGDGYDDLAIGVPGEFIGGIRAAGAVNVLYGIGNNIGLSSLGSQLWYQDSPGILDESQVEDYFGNSLAAGDFDGDGFGDLAIGVIGESVSNHEAGGAVCVLYGSGDGLLSADNQLWNQDSPGIFGEAGSYDFLGRSVSTGDFDGDGYDDLAIGADWDDVGNTGTAGSVNVIYGSESGLASSRNQNWSQNSTGILGVSQSDDSFGIDLSTGDFDGDGIDDLAIAVIGEALDPFTRAGVANVLYGLGGGSGLTSSGNQLWHQNSAGILDQVEDLDYFGASVAAGDFDGDGYADLAIGVHREDIGVIVDAGAVNVLYGSSPANSPKENLEQQMSGETASHSELQGNYPNPFNPVTTIAYSIREVGPVKLTVYNTLGQLVATLVDVPFHPAGEFTASFDASHLASGVFFYRLETTALSQIKRMMFVK